MSLSIERHFYSCQFVHQKLSITSFTLPDSYHLGALSLVISCMHVELITLTRLPTARKHKPQADEIGPQNLTLAVIFLGAQTFT